MNTEHLAKEVLKTSSPTRRVTIQKYASLFLGAQRITLALFATTAAFLVFGIIAIIGVTFLSRGNW